MLPSSENDLKVSIIIIIRSAGIKNLQIFSMPFEIPLITINAQENVKIKCRSMGINVPEENLSKYSDALSIEELKI